MTKAKPIKVVDVDLHLPDSESEVSIGGEAFTVRVRGAAKVDHVAAVAKDLYLACLPTQERTQEAGFALPVAEGRFHPAAPGTSSPYQSPVTVGPFEAR